MGLCTRGLASGLTSGCDCWTRGGIVACRCWFHKLCLLHQRYSACLCARRCESVTQAKVLLCSTHAHVCTQLGTLRAAKLASCKHQVFDGLCMQVLMLGRLQTTTPFDRSVGDHVGTLTGASD
jgi:hypothetical protein